MRARLHYAWVIAAVTFVVLLVTAGIRATPGVLMVSLESEFGWTRTAISGAVAINIALFGLLGPFAASVMDRWGLRRVVLGALCAAGGLGGADHAHAEPVAAHAAVGCTGRDGYRRHVDGPRRHRRQPLVRRAARPMAPVEALRHAMSSRAFWILAGTFFVCGASTNGLIGTHLIAACHDYGIAEIRSAQLLAMMGIFDIIGTTASGWLTDRYSSRHLLFGYYTLRGISLLFLPLTLQDGGGQLAWFAVFYGLDWIATVPPTVRLTSEAFGRENTGVIYGWSADLWGEPCQARLANPTGFAPRKQNPR